GGVILDAPVERLKRDVLTYKTVRLQLAAGSQLPRKLPGVEVKDEGSSVYRLSIDLGMTTIEEALAAIVAACRIDDVTIEDPPMEEVIQHIYAGGRSSGAREEYA